jgi:peptidoglycan/xylan/chitin deacetylase (PgdA/CDA1 family)
MKREIKLLAGTAMTVFGLPRLLHRAMFRDQLTIVMYHGVVREPLDIGNWCFIEEACFRDQINYLKDHFHVVRFSEAIELLSEGRIDHPTATVTFDDGFQNNYDVAFPILREAGMPAIIFLTTGFLNSTDTLWFCRLNQAMVRTDRSKLDWNGRKYDLSSRRNKAQALYAIEQLLTPLPHGELLSQVRKIVKALGCEPDESIGSMSPFRMLSYEAIDEMRMAGIEFGAHTYSHCILSRLSSEERRHEIETSVQAVTALTGQRCEFFAYPNGREDDYNAETIFILQSIGIKAAVTAQPGPNKSSDSLLTLKRYGFGVGDTLLHFQTAAHHTTYHIKRLLPI